MGIVTSASLVVDIDSHGVVLYVVIAVDIVDVEVFQVYVACLADIVDLDGDALVLACAGAVVGQFEVVYLPVLDVIEFDGGIGAVGVDPWFDFSAVYVDYDWLSLGAASVWEEFSGVA